MYIYKYFMNAIDVVFNALISGKEFIVYYVNASLQLYLTMSATTYCYCMPVCDINEDGGVLPPWVSSHVLKK